MLRFHSQKSCWHFLHKQFHHHVFGKKAHIWPTVRLFATHKFSRVNHHVAKSTCFFLSSVSLLWSTQLDFVRFIQTFCLSSELCQEANAKLYFHLSTTQTFHASNIASHSEARKINDVRQNKFYLWDCKASPQVFFSCFPSLCFFLSWEFSGPYAFLLPGRRIQPPKAFEQNLDFARNIVTQNGCMTFWLFLPRRSTMHITVGKLWEENKINLAENTAQPGGKSISIQT